ncbi:MAG: hypothetical protein CME64_01700 [Halobacteriovoraceae bacterium]|nr:hypothetical protein [Halobacteriovoraceae bacterium]|tara:strand:+ start:85249 stop:86283 length:1035 start_codon:yes stop_codon:yes gene_type:complete
MELYLEETKRLINAVVEKNAHGELKEMIDYHFETWGKLNRPKAIGLLAQALSTDALSTVGWAAGLEMFHNGTLIHDDIQDGDILRRSRPSLWKRYSSNMAINAGDFLMINATECILDSELDLEKKHMLMSLFNKLASEVMDGQCREFKLSELESCKGISNRYLECAGMKTASLYSHLARGVGIIANKAEEECVELEDVFYKLGLLMQMQDDIIDLYGDKQRDMQGNDIKEGKVSFLIVKHLENNQNNFEAIKKLLFRNRENILRGEVLIIKEQFIRDGTLARALSELTDRSYALLKHEYLQTNPEVEGVIQIFIEELMKPLRGINETIFNINEGLSKQIIGHSF